VEIAFPIMAKGKTEGKQQKGRGQVFGFSKLAGESVPTGESDFRPISKNRTPDPCLNINGSASDQQDCRMARPLLQCSPFARLPPQASFSPQAIQSIGIKFMVYRPRTKAKLAKKTKRCPKCGKIVRGKVRCKTCHLVQK
jgi:hypothetical protein